MSDLAAPDLPLTDSYDVLPDTLRHADSYKWTKYEEGVLPLWVADMDFPVAPSIVAALQSRLTRGLGYHQLLGDPELKRLLMTKLEQDGLPGLSPEGIAFLPGVVPGLYAAVQGLTQPGEEVLTFTPIYPPFLSAVTDHGRVLREVPLLVTAQGYQLDRPALEASVSDKTKLLMLCHPHNPTGRVWTPQELQQLAEFALKHRLHVVSDELHADLRYSDAPTYLPFAAVNADLARRTVTLTGPCKAYNTAGLGIGAMMSHDPELIAKLERAVKGVMGHPSALSVTMWQAALQSGAEWLTQTVTYLQSNRDFLSAYLAEHLPEVPYHAPQATYLAWLDLRASPQAQDIQQFLLNEAKIALNDGPTFGSGYQGFVRLNYATSRSILAAGLKRLSDALQP